MRGSPQRTGRIRQEMIVPVQHLLDLRRHAAGAGCGRRRRDFVKPGGAAGVVLDGQNVNQSFIPDCPGPFGIAVDAE
jgi:hypothetical protein